MKGMTREALEEWHRPRIESLIEGKVSLLALETMPGSLEVKCFLIEKIPSDVSLLSCVCLPLYHHSYLKVLAALDCLAKSSVILPAWVSFSIKDGDSLCGGEPIEDAVRMVLKHPMAKSGRIVAIGVNCCNPDHVTPALTKMRSVSKTTPLVVYPNSGEVWDGEGRVWRGEGGQWVEHVKDWVSNS